MTFAATKIALLISMMMPGGTRPLPAAFPVYGCTELLFGTTRVGAPDSETALVPCEETYGTLSSCHFQVLYAHRLPAKQVVSVTNLLERTHDLFYHAFTDAGFHLNPIQEPLHCRFFETRAEFDRYAWTTERQRFPWLDSYYSPRTNRVALLLESREPDAPPFPDNVTTAAFQKRTHPGRHEPDDFQMRIAHEAAHQLAFNSGLQKRGVMYPFWVAEGLAASFETNGHLGPGMPNPVRREHLLNAWQAGHLRPFDDFLVMVEPICGSRKELNDLYAQAWGIFHYLFTHHPDKLRDYLARLADRSPGRRSTEARRHDLVAALPPLCDLQNEWLRHMRDLQQRERNARGSDTLERAATASAPIQNVPLVTSR